MTTERIAYLEALVAVKDEALTRISDGQVMSGQFTHADTVLAYQEIARTALSASAETVQAFRDKLTEPLRGHIEEASSLANMQDIAIESLRREVAMHNALLKNIDRSYNDGAWIDWTPIIAAINDTQATAEAYEREVEARCAVKALEDITNRLERKLIKAGTFSSGKHTTSEVISLLGEVEEEMCRTNYEAPELFSGTLGELNALSIRAITKKE